MMLSVVIPTLNEAGFLARTLEALERQQGPLEVIVVDGGSSDDTAEIAARLGARILHADRGRGLQMRAGASVAVGDVLWFLHADTVPPDDAAERIRAALSSDKIHGGFFALQFDGGGRAAGLLTRVYPHLGRLGLTYGDSGMFVRRTAYERAGGFQPFPIFEDLDLMRGLKRAGTMVRLKCPVVTSSRRFENRSFPLTFAHWTAMQILYWIGVHPRTLGRMYRAIR